MKFTFTDKKTNTPKRVIAYAEKKVGKLEKFFTQEPEVSLVFGTEKGRHQLEVTLRSNSTVIRVFESTPDMFVSIDAAVASIERQLRKNKSRLEKRLRQDAFVDIASLEDAYFSPEVEEEPEFNVIRSKHFNFRPMSVEEAILQMNLIGHTFFAFRNQEENEAFSIVYRRNDGDYGLIIDEQ